MELTKSLLANIIKWTAATEAKMKSILSSKGKGNSKLFQTLKLSVKEKENEIVIVSTLPEYAIYVDQGRRAGKQPPIKSIKEWCRQKGISETAAFPIAKKIGEYGIPATNFLVPMRKITDLVKEIQKDTVEYTLEQIKEINKEFEKE